MGKMFNCCFLLFNCLVLKIHIPGKAAVKSIHPHTPAADAFIMKKSAFEKLGFLSGLVLIH